MVRQMRRWKRRLTIRSTRFVAESRDLVCERPSWRRHGRDASQGNCCCHYPGWRASPPPHLMLLLAPPITVDVKLEVCPSFGRLSRALSLSLSHTHAHSLTQVSLVAPAGRSANCRGRQQTNLASQWLQQPVSQLRRSRSEFDFESGGGRFTRSNNNKPGAREALGSMRRAVAEQQLRDAAACRPVEPTANK